MGLFSTFWREPEFGSEAMPEGARPTRGSTQRTGAVGTSQAAALGTTLPPAKFRGKIQEAKSL